MEKEGLHGIAGCRVVTLEFTTKVGRARKGEGEERQRDGKGRGGEGGGRGKGENEGEEETVEEEVCKVISNVTTTIAYNPIGLVLRVLHVQ